jgi:hypothetical protein
MLEKLGRIQNWNAMKSAHFRRKVNWILSPDAITAFVILLLALSSAVSTAQGADRTINWHPWQEWAEFRVRTGDRYLGNERWEHYLGFELYRPSTKRIKISMIYLGKEAVPDVVIDRGRRYGIVKVTNSAMTAIKDRWNWTAEEVQSTTHLSHVGLAE